MPWRPRRRRRRQRSRSGRVSRTGERLKDTIGDPDRHLCGTHGLVEKVFIFGSWPDQEELASRLANGVHTRGKV